MNTMQTPELKLYYDVNLSLPRVGGADIVDAKESAEKLIDYFIEKNPESKIIEQHRSYLSRLSVKEPIEVASDVNHLTNLVNNCLVKNGVAVAARKLLREDSDAETLLLGALMHVSSSKKRELLATLSNALSFALSDLPDEYFENLPDDFANPLDDTIEG